MVVFVFRGLIRKNLAISKRLSSVPRRQFSDKYDSGKKRRSFETAVISIGIVGSIAAGGIILARKNEQFRDTLRTTLPFGDKIVEFTCSDVNTIFGRTVGTDDEDNLNAVYYSMLMGVIDRMKKSVNETIDKLFSKKSDQIFIEKRDDSNKPIPMDLAASNEPYKPPKPIFEKFETEKKKLPEGHHELRQIESEAEKNVEVILKVEPQKTNENLDGCEYDPAKIATLENRLSSQVKEAIDTYQEGIRVLKIYSEDIEKIVDSATDFNDDNLWFNLKQATLRRNELLDKAEQLLNDACQTRSDLNVIFTDTRINIDDDLKKQVKRKMNHLFEDLDMARTQFDVQKERASVTQKFWENVKKARDKFCNELETLFPDIDFSKPSIHFEDTDALDLFLLYVQTQFMLLEKKYSHLETIGQNTINSIMGSDNLEDKQTKMIEFFAAKKYQDLKTQLDNDFQKKSIELRINTDRDLRKQLKIQQQVAIDHVSESLDEQRADLEDRFSDELNKALNQERERYHIRLAEMVGRLVTIETSLKKRTVADRHAKKAQLFWSACENLYSSIGMTNAMYGPKKRTHLINQELDLVLKTAGDSDDFVATIIDSIPPSVINGGVYTEEGLRDRFVKVEAVVRRLALVPENGGSLYVYFMSFMQSLFIKKSVTEIPEKELLNELVNFNDLDTFDIIARARYWMDRGDFPLVLRYMNLLNGAPRKISQDWIDELRKFVEMKLAAKALMTHAIANGLTNLELLS